MNEYDKLLLEAYMNGFKDELYNKKSNVNLLLLHAYNLGKEDAIIGDDVTSIDYQSNDEILKRIHNESHRNKSCVSH